MGPLGDLASDLLDAGDGLGGWAYPIVGALAFAEAALFVGLVLPGELAVVAGGVLAARGVISVPVLILVVFASAVAGDVTGYAAGRKLGRPFALRYGRRFGVTDERLARVESLLRRHGGKAILGARFVGFVRSLAPFVAGTARMSFPRFLAADVVSCAAWAIAFSLLGYVFWESGEAALKAAQWLKFVLAGLVLLAAAAYVIVRRVRPRA